jgi:hypothetical protein
MFWAIFASKFILVGMLLVALPIKRAVQRMPDTRLKRFLLVSWD